MTTLTSLIARLAYNTLSTCIMHSVSIRFFLHILEDKLRFHLPHWLLFIAYDLRLVCAEAPERDSSIALRVPVCQETDLIRIENGDNLVWKFKKANELPRRTCSIRKENSSIKKIFAWEYWNTFYFYVNLSVRNEPFNIIQIYLNRSNKQT